MARLRVALAALTALAAGCGSIEYGSDEPETVVYEAEAPARDDISVSVFIRELSPYGEWVDVAPHGRVFVPDDPDYRPYRDGRWVYTEDGVTWVSYDAIGWAVAHYGSWTILPDGRWAWIPGTEWYPADVEWRSNDTYVGWAPSLVEAQPPVASWVFVQPTYLFSTYALGAAIPWDDVPSVYASCPVRTGWRRGPSRRWMRRHRVSARGARVAVARPGGRGHARPGRRPAAQGARVRRRVPRGTVRRRAEGAEVRRLPGGVGGSRAGLRSRERWVPRETVVLGGRPVPEHRGRDGSVVMPSPRVERRAPPPDLHPARPPVGGGPQPPRASMPGPRPRSRPAPRAHIAPAPGPMPRPEPRVQAPAAPPRPTPAPRHPMVVQRHRVPRAAPRPTPAPVQPSRPRTFAPRPSPPSRPSPPPTVRRRAFTPAPSRPSPPPRRAAPSPARRAPMVTSRPSPRPSPPPRRSSSVRRRSSSATVQRRSSSSRSRSVTRSARVPSRAGGRVRVRRR